MAHKLMKQDVQIYAKLGVANFNFMNKSFAINMDRDPDFSKSWLNNQRSILIILTLGGSAIVMLWQLFDKFYIEEYTQWLSWLRVATIAVYLGNLLVCYFRRSERAVKQHLVAGFYFGTVFCMLLAIFTGASQSPYWFGLFFIIMAWFILVPYTFGELAVHSLSFVIMFVAGQYAQNLYPVVQHEMMKIIFLYSGTLLVGFASAYIRNRLDKERTQVQKELQKFRLVMDQAPGAVFIIDKNSCFEYLNPQFTKMSGYTIDDLLHKNINETLYKGNIPDSRRGIIDQIKSGKTWQGELLTRRKDGSEYWANTIASPYLGENGESDGYIVIQQDITKRKQLEDALREREKLHQTLIEEALEGVVISQDYKFNFVNKAFSSMVGYTLDELNEIGPLGVVAPEDRQRLSAFHEKRMKGEVGNQTYTADFVRKDGSRFTAELNASSVVLNGANASYITMRDITDRQAYERALSESEKKYRELAEMLPQAVYELDSQGNITYMNETGLRKFDITKKDLGIPAFKFIVPEQHQKMKENMQRSLKEGYHTPGNNYTAVRKNGERFPVLIFAAPMIVDGQICGTRGIILDMTEHEAIKAALKESEEKYKILIEKALDGIIITQNGLFKFVNQAFCEMMQYQVEELIDRPYFDFVVPDDHEMMKEYHKRRMEGEEFQVMYRSKIIRKDGTILHVELNTRTSYFEGKPAAFIITRNITDRLKTEEELLAAKKELEALNNDLENRVQESSSKLTEVNTQLIRMQKENLQSQFEVLRQQVNPHFLFNSLNVLTSLIKLEPDLAEKFTEHLSKVYRYVLENKDNDLVRLETELEFLDAYIFLLNIRFMEKIAVEVKISDESKDMLILPLALQLLIENAIKHNAMSKKNPLKIEIFIDENEVLNVVNNLQERESHMASTGVGLKNIEHRYKLLEMRSPEFYKSENQFVAKIPLIR